MLCPTTSFRTLGAASIVMLTASIAGAQAPPSPASPHDRPFEITDNSFFVEEAFNQERGVYQNIAGATFLLDAGWAATFTQEWPAPSIRHQLSFTVPFGRVNDETGLGDVALNYRYQLLEEGPGRPAISPRATVLAPSGSTARGLGVGAWGLQFNVPVSKQVEDVYLHGNAGLTWYPHATSSIADSAGAPDPSGAAEALESPFLAGSVLYRVRPMFNLMLESVVSWQEQFVAAGRTDRARVTILSPGVRGGWNHGDSQYIVGAALPVTWVGSRNDAGLFLYLCVRDDVQEALHPVKAHRGPRGSEGAGDGTGNVSAI